MTGLFNLSASHSRSSHVFSQMVARLLKKSWAKSLDSMDATFSKLDQPEIAVTVLCWLLTRYFIIWFHVIGYPQCPPYYMYGNVITPSWWWVWTSDLPESVGGSNIIFYLPRKVSEAINFSRRGNDNIYYPVFQKLSDWYVSVIEDCPGKIVWISS